MAPLQVPEYIEAEDWKGSRGPIEFNFCKSLLNTDATCDFDIYAGIFQYIGNTTHTVCEEALSGPVSDTNAFKSIQFGVLDSTNNDSMIDYSTGVKLTYSGSKSGNYVEMLIYCSEEEFSFSNTY